MLKPETSMEMINTITREYHGTSPEAREVLMKIATARRRHGLTVPWESGDHEKDSNAFIGASALVDWAISAAFGEWGFLADDSYHTWKDAPTE